MRRNRRFNWETFESLREKTEVDEDKKRQNMRKNKIKVIWLGK